MTDFEKTCKIAILNGYIDSFNESKNKDYLKEINIIIKKLIINK